MTDAMLTAWSVQPCGKSRHDPPRLPVGEREVTDRQLDVLTAWWKLGGSNRRAAVLLGISEQRVKNTLYDLRRIEGARSNIELVQRHFEEVQPRNITPTEGNP